MTEEPADVQAAPIPMPTAESPPALSDLAEIMFRQVHPTLFDEGEPTSSAFMPNPSDNGQLSVDRSTLTTAQAAFELFISNSLRSAGAYGVTVGEFKEQDLKCYADPVKASAELRANPAHARVDFSAMGSSKRKTVAKRLKIYAVGRGILHKP